MSTISKLVSYFETIQEYFQTQEQNPALPKDSEEDLTNEVSNDVERRTRSNSFTERFRFRVPSFNTFQSKNAIIENQIDLKYQKPDSDEPTEAISSPLLISEAAVKTPQNHTIEPSSGINHTKDPPHDTDVHRPEGFKNGSPNFNHRCAALTNTGYLTQNSVTDGGECSVNAEPSSEEKSEESEKFGRKIQNSFVSERNIQHLKSSTLNNINTNDCLNQKLARKHDFEQIPESSKDHQISAISNNELKSFQTNTIGQNANLFLTDEDEPVYLKTPDTHNESHSDLEQTPQVQYEGRPQEQQNSNQVADQTKSLTVMTNYGRHYAPCHTQDDCHAWDCSDHSSQWLHNMVLTRKEKAVSKAGVIARPSLSSDRKTNKESLDTPSKEKDIPAGFCSDYDRMVTGTPPYRGGSRHGSCYQQQHSTTPAYLDTILESCNESKQCLGQVGDNSWHGTNEVQFRNFGSFDTLENKDKRQSIEDVIDGKSNFQKYVTDLIKRKDKKSSVDNSLSTKNSLHQYIAGNNDVEQGKNGLFLMKPISVDESALMTEEDSSSLNLIKSVGNNNLETKQSTNEPPDDEYKCLSDEGQAVSANTRLNINYSAQFDTATTSLSSTNTDQTQSLHANNGESCSNIQNCQTALHEVPVSEQFLSLSQTNSNDTHNLAKRHNLPTNNDAKTKYSKKQIERRISLQVIPNTEVLEESLSMTKEDEEKKNSMPSNYSYYKRNSWRQKKSISFDLEPNNMHHLCHRQGGFKIIFFSHYPNLYQIFQLNSSSKPNLILRHRRFYIYSIEFADVSPNFPCTTWACLK